MDFSENYTAKYQSEVQSMHFGASKKQISLHTVVCYYNNGEQIIPKSYCTVSDDLAHQAFAVWAHLDPVLNHLSKEFPQTYEINFFSDSPSSQYRNRTNLFLFKSLLMNYFPLLKAATWNFSEPGHGKGPMDGVGGTLKRQADQMVLYGQDITKASDFVKAFHGSKITVIEIPKGKVEESKKYVSLNIAPVPHISKIKQVTLNLDNNTMYGRALSCAKCSYNICTHYHLNEIFSTVEEPKKKKMKKCRKLKVDDIWSSDNETLETNNQSGPSCIMKEVTKELNCNTSNINVGNYLLIRYISKSSQMHQFVGVCQDVDIDVKVMYIKEVNEDKTLFLVDESEVSYVSTDQIVAVLPPPRLVLKGSRVFYKFNCKINVFKCISICETWELSTPPVKHVHLNYLICSLM